MKGGVAKFEIPLDPALRGDTGTGLADDLLCIGIGAGDTFANFGIGTSRGTAGT